MIQFILGSAVVSVILFCLYIRKFQDTLDQRFPEFAAQVLPASPYSVAVAKNKNGDFGYTVLRNGRRLYITNTQSYVVYTTFEKAMLEMNRLEQFDNVKVTRNIK